MKNTSERAALILLRTEKLQSRRRRRGDAVTGAVCCALACCLIGALRLVSADGTAHIPGLYGSALLYGGAGGYVLTGVLAFAVGAVITALCIRYRKRKDGHKNNEPEQGEKKQ